jgi:hypothetical protein
MLCLASSIGIWSAANARHMQCGAPTGSRAGGSICTSLLVISLSPCLLGSTKAPLVSCCCREQEEREERDRLRREGKPLPPELARSSSDDYHNGGDRGSRGDRGDRGGFGGMWPPGSHDDSDPFSTNLYVGNIHPEVGL